MAALPDRAAMKTFQLLPLFKPKYKGYDAPKKPKRKKPKTYKKAKGKPKPKPKGSYGAPAKGYQPAYSVQEQSYSPPKAAAPAYPSFPAYPTSPIPQPTYAPSPAPVPAYPVAPTPEPQPAYPAAAVVPEEPKPLSAQGANWPTVPS